MSDGEVEHAQLTPDRLPSELVRDPQSRLGGSADVVGEGGGIGALEGSAPGSGGGAHCRTPR